MCDGRNKNCPLYSYKHCCAFEGKSDEYRYDHCDNVFDRGDCLLTEEVMRNPEKFKELYIKYRM